MPNQYTSHTNLNTSRIPRWVQQSICCFLVTMGACVLVLMTWYLLNPTPSAHNRTKRWAMPDDLDDLMMTDDEFPHDYSTNLWWRLMNKTAHAGQATNCYVCAHLPYSTHNSGLRPVTIPEEHQTCLYALSTLPGEDPWRDRDYTSPVSPDAPSKNFHLAVALASMDQNYTFNCSVATNIMPLPQMPLQLPEIITLSRLKPTSLGFCIYNNGTNPVGSVPWNLCKKVYTFCDPYKIFHSVTALKQDIINKIRQRKEYNISILYLLQREGSLY